MKTNNWIWVIVVMVLLMVVFSSINHNLEYGDKTEEEIELMDQEENAYHNAKQLIKYKLKSPSTAEFPSSLEAKVIGVGDNTFIVSSYVDAQNSYGAMIRTYYEAEIRYNGNDGVQLVHYEFKK
jgi:hypothetical protein